MKICFGIDFIQRDFFLFEFLQNFRNFENAQTNLTRKNPDAGQNDGWVCVNLNMKQEIKGSVGSKWDRVLLKDA